MRKLIVGISILAILASCSDSKNTGGRHNRHRHEIKNNRYNRQDGLSFNTAVFINEKSEMAGTRAEYEWIKSHYTDYKIKSQSLTRRDGKPYDVIIITLRGGKDLNLYFDISKYFGKF